MPCLNILICLNDLCGCFWLPLLPFTRWWPFESLFVVHNNSDPSERHTQANLFCGYQFRPLLCNEVGQLTVFLRPIDYLQSHFGMAIIMVTCERPSTLFVLQVTLNSTLTDRDEYLVSNAKWHQIRTATGLIYGFCVLSESEGSKFSVIIQNTLRSLQGTGSILRLNEAYLIDSCIVNRGQWLWNPLFYLFVHFFQPLPWTKQKHTQIYWTMSQ